MILAGRRINDNMSMYVSTQIIKLMLKKSIQPKGARVLVLGLVLGAALYAATLGGMGLTGHMLEVELELHPARGVELGRGLAGLWIVEAPGELLEGGAVALAVAVGGVLVGMHSLVQK